MGGRPAFLSVCLTVSTPCSLCVSPSLSLSHTRPHPHLLSGHGLPHHPPLLPACCSLMHCISAGSVAQRSPRYGPLGLEFFLKSPHVLFCAEIYLSWPQLLIPIGTENILVPLVCGISQNHPHPILMKTNTVMNIIDREEPNLRVSFSNSWQLSFYHMLLLFLSDAGIDQHILIVFFFSETDTQRTMSD